jgi:hypothetical protein
MEMRDFLLHITQKVEKSEEQEEKQTKTIVEFFGRFFFQQSL